MPYPSTSWMSDLDDNRKLTDLTLPGTHDTCTYMTRGLAQCQSMDLETQFKSGVRFWDIRLKVKNGQMIAFHGPVKLDLTFDNILLSSYILLRQFPKECLVMCISHEGNKDNEELHEKLWPVIENLDYWYKEDRIPRLGEVRGKVVFMRRFRAPLSNFPIGINAYDNWPVNGTKSWESSAAIRFTVQDKYKGYLSVNRKEKFDKNVKPMLDKAINRSPENSRLYINFTSGTVDGGGSAFFPPESLATETNPKLFDYLTGLDRARLGIIPMDFPESVPGLIERLIRCNFDPFSKITFQQPTTFENETDGTWTLSLFSGEPALFYIKTVNTPSGRVEVHAASKESSYQKRIFERATVFTNENNGTWLISHNKDARDPFKHHSLPDLVYIKTKNTPSNKVEVHIASGASGYQEIKLQTETCFDCEDNGVWTMAQNGLYNMLPDLVYIKTKNTLSNKVEVHIASGALSYQKATLQKETCFHYKDTGVWSIGGRSGGRDLTFIKTSDTPSGNVEVHIASAKSNYEMRTLECETAFTCGTEGVWLMQQFTPGNFNDLILIKTTNTPDNHVEVQVAMG